MRVSGSSRLTACAGGGCSWGTGTLMIDWAGYLAKLGAAFLLWTFVIYWMHRFSHVRWRWNPLWKVHRAHHLHPYLRCYEPAGWPKVGQWFLWLGDWQSSLDVIVQMTIPLLVIAWFMPDVGLPLLAFHYIYEVFLSENQLDHNPKITGRVTRWFAWGDFHLQHHVHPKQNIGLMITLWDRLFGTANDPQPGMAWRRIEAHRDRLAERAATNELQPSVLAQ